MIATLKSIAQSVSARNGEKIKAIEVAAKFMGYERRAIEDDRASIIELSFKAAFDDIRATSKM
ncbi:MAG: hypothetical protein H7061_11400 [Bdellovibrionaceae bacterium]|nr:hypothetical protein [Bdellovibrio sp.]